jgi:hypothetical protein
LTDDWSKEVRLLVYNNLHKTYRNRARALFLRDTREALFAYPSLASTGFCDTAVVWDTEEEAWHGPFPLDVSCFVPPALHDVLFVDSVGDICRIVETVHSTKGIDVIRIGETGDQFIGLQAVSLDGGTTINFTPGTVFQVTGLRLEFEPTSGTMQVQIGHRMGIMDDLVYEDPDTVDLTSLDGYEITRICSGRWFRIKFTVPDSAQLRLVGYQWIFTPTGRY